MRWEHFHIRPIERAHASDNGLAAARRVRNVKLQAIDVTRNATQSIPCNHLITRGRVTHATLRAAQAWHEVRVRRATPGRFERHEASIPGKRRAVILALMLRQAPEPV